MKCKSMFITLSTVVVLVSLVLAACAPAPTAKPAEPTATPVPKPIATPKPEPVTLQYMTYEADPFLEPVFKRFHELHPNVSVEHVDGGGYDNFLIKLQTGIVSGEAPDSWFAEPGMMADFLVAGSLLDLMPYIERDNVDLGIYYQDIVDSMRYKGGLYALPMGWVDIVMVYNKDLFDKAGVPYPTDDWTWNPSDGGDFLDLAQRLTLDKNGKHPTDPGFDPDNIEQYGFALNNWWWTESWIYSNGGKYMDKDLFPDKCLLGEKKAVEAMQFVADLLLKYHVMPSPDFLGAFAGEGSIQAFYTGNIAMTMIGTWHLADFQKITDFEWDVVPVPIGPAGRVAYAGYSTVAAFAGIKHPEETWQWLKFFAGEESQNMYHSLDGNPSGIPATMDTWLDSFKGKPPANVAAFGKSMEKTGTDPVGPGMNEIFDLGMRAWDLVLLGEKTVAEAYGEVMEQANQIVAEKKAE